MRNQEAIKSNSIRAKARVMVEAIRRDPNMRAKVIEVVKVEAIEAGTTILNRTTMILTTVILNLINIFRS